MRLVGNSSHSNAGILQFLHPVLEGTDWLYSCNSAIDIHIISVVCRMLGYDSDSRRISFSSKLKCIFSMHADMHELASIYIRMS